MLCMKPTHMDFNDLFLQVIPENSISNQPARRTLLQAAESDVKPPISFNISTGPCIMLWAQNLNISLAPSSWVDLAAQNATLAGSSCEGTNSRWDAMHLLDVQNSCFNVFNYSTNVNNLYFLVILQACPQLPIRLYTQVRWTHFSFEQIVQKCMNWNIFVTSDKFWIADCHN